jgi:hypothetical protein
MMIGTPLTIIGKDCEYDVAKRQLHQPLGTSLVFAPIWLLDFSNFEVNDASRQPLRFCRAIKPFSTSCCRVLH